MTGIRALTLGVTGSGKSRYNFEVLCHGAPRILSIDTNGEAVHLGGRVVADGYVDTLHVLGRVATLGTWHVAAYLPDPDDVRKLAHALLYKKKLADPSLSERLGGLVVESGECSEFAPNPSPIEIRALWLRGRHYKVWPVVATQRPTECATVVRSMSDVLTIFRMHDDRALDWVARNIGDAVANVVAALPEYHAVTWRTVRGDCQVFDASRRVYRTLAISSRGRAALDRTGDGP